MYLDNGMLKYSSELPSSIYNDEYAHREALEGERHSDSGSYNPYDCDCLKLLALPFACFLCCVWPLSLCSGELAEDSEELAGEHALLHSSSRPHHLFRSWFASTR